MASRSPALAAPCRVVIGPISTSAPGPFATLRSTGSGAIHAVRLPPAEPGNCSAVEANGLQIAAPFVTFAESDVHSTVREKTLKAEARASQGEPFNGL